VKVLAFLAVDLAGAGVFVGVRDSLQPWWWVPLIGLAVSATFFASTLWPRQFDSGPNLRQFYEKWGGSTLVDVHRQMMGELLDAIDKNKRILPSKERAFNIGAGVLALTIIGGAIFLRASTVTTHNHHGRSTRVTVATFSSGHRVHPATKRHHSSNPSYRSHSVGVRIAASASIALLAWAAPVSAHVGLGLDLVSPSAALTAWAGPGYFTGTTGYISYLGSTQSTISTDSPSTCSSSFPNSYGTMVLQAGVSGCGGEAPYAQAGWFS